MSWHCIKAAIKGLIFGIEFLIAIVVFAAAVTWGLTSFLGLLGPQIASLICFVGIGMALAYAIGSFVVISLEEAGCLTKKETSYED